MKCITLTLNPAFDKHCFVENFRIGYEHLAEDEFCESGGKGVNISRALLTNGVHNKAIIVLGKENKDAFCSGLNADSMNYTSITIDGKVRENLTIHASDGVETRISYRGFTADDSLLDNVYNVINDDLSEDAILTFTGSAPVGVSMEGINNFLKKIADKGVKIVIDSKSFKTLEEIVALKPWLIKPNGEEISAYLKREITTHEEILEIAKSLHNQGVENVMISLGEKGAMLVSKDGAYIAAPPEVEAKSTIGAGDSSIAGFISAVMQGKSVEDALKTSIAFGTAACLREGTLPPLPEAVEKILGDIIITKL